MDLKRKTDDAATPDERPLSGSLSWGLTGRAHAWRPPTDIYETEDALVVRVEVAGMNETDFSIQLDGKTLSIRGVRPDVPERRAYHLMEIRFGDFHVEIELPLPILAEGVAAEYQNGFLRVLLPKARPQQIPIREQNS